MNRFTLFVFLSWHSLTGQSIQTSLPKTIDSEKTYVFYLHGGIIQDEGIDATSTYFGKYEYTKILETLKNYNLEVISERRPKGTIELEYAKKVSAQINTLMRHSVPVERIIVVGASQGAWITLELANIKKNSKIKYAILGLCNDYNVNYFSKYKNELCGNFLSIYERSDQKKSCETLLNSPFCKSGFKEIALNMGNDHGFLYKPYDEWVLPLVDWIKNEN
ncbi:MAG: hypothetical protein HC811_03125 [Flammeovirgaceae bacterium]|nr:hypothetical protein [Flammeovirgaceae bacterium]